VPVSGKRHALACLQSLCIRFPVKASEYPLADHMATVQEELRIN